MSESNKNNYIYNDCIEMNISINPSRNNDVIHVKTIEIDNKGVVYVDDYKKHNSNFVI